jgi:hypothetical protein
MLGLAAALGAGSSLFQLITGATQKRQANKLQRQFEALQGNRPEYSTPQEVLTATALSRQAFADPNMPGQGAMYDRTALAGQNTAAAAAAGGDPFGAAVAAQAATNRSNEQIGVQSANFAEQARVNYQGQLGQLAQFRDQEYQMNEFAPWKDKSQYLLNEFRDMRQAGNQNVYGGIDGIGRVGIAALSGMAGMNSGGGISAQASQDILSRNQGGNPALSQDQINMMFKILKGI